MRRNKSLALIAIFATLFAGCGTLFAQDATNFKQLTMMKGHHKDVTSVSCSPDGKYLASGASDETIVIWDVNSGAKLKILEGHEKTVTSVSWSPDGQYLASASKDKTIVIWDVNSGQKVKTLQGHTKNVNTVCWSPDGKYLASGSRDKTVIVWDANSGAILQTMKGHSFGVNCVSWSPDGKYLASASWDMSIVLWNPNNGRNLQTLKGHTFSVESLCWTPDSKYLISGAGDQTVRIWSEETEYIYIKMPFPDKKPERDIVTTENKPENGVETEQVQDSKPETGVETEQTQIEKPAKKVIKKSIERTGEATVITEYDKQGNIIKITKINCSGCGSFEFNLKDGKIISAKDEYESDFGTTSVIDKQKNIVTIVRNSEFSTFEFNEFGIKNITIEYPPFDYRNSSYEYNKDGLLVKEVEDAYAGTSSKTTITYTYDVMSQDWTKRTGKDNKGYKTVTTRTVEYW